jgi:hypothetical protein
MAYQIGTLTKGAGDDTHYQFLAVVKALAEANGWTTLKYDTVSANREWIGKSLGLSGTEEIYIGIQCYQNSVSDYYNLAIATFVGYVPGNTFETQPGAKIAGIPAHNNALTYYLTVNAQRILFGLKVGTPVYVHGYAGKIFPYSRSGEFPAPLVVAGMFTGGAEARRYSDTNQQFPWGGAILGTGTGGSAMWLRDLSGTWVQSYHYPFSNGNSRVGALFGTPGSYCLVPAGTEYQLEPIVLYDKASGTTPANVWGEVDGVYFVSGFNNAVENVVQMGGSSVVDQTGMSVLQAVDAIIAVGGRAFVVVQNVTRTTFADYVALEMK